MNLAQRSKFAEDSAERMDAIEQHAAIRCRAEPEYTPITLELTNRAESQHILAGFDVYGIKMEDIQEGGRVRLATVLTIDNKFAEFVTHQSYAGLMIHIPRTEHNLKTLATHKDDGLWKIHQPETREVVDKLAEKIDNKLRDVVYENQTPQYMSQSASMASLQSENERLKKMLEEKDFAANDKKAEREKFDEDNIKPNDDRGPQNIDKAGLVLVGNRKTIEDKIRREVIEKYKDRIDEEKRKHKGNYWITSFYRNVCKPEIEQRVAERMSIEKQLSRGVPQNANDQPDNRNGETATPGLEQPGSEGGNSGT